MSRRRLDREDLWDLVLGGSVLATGGGVSPTREQFDAYVDPILEDGVQPELLDPAALDDDAMVYMEVGAGGGVRRADRERYLLPSAAGRWRDDVDPTGWIQDRLAESDHLYPLGSWAAAPERDWHQRVNRSMADLAGGEADAYLSFEIGPNIFMELLAAASEGKPLIDADVAGHRSVPEISLSSFNIHGIPAQPVLFASPWGDLVTLERTISWQRMEDIGRHLAIVGGGGVRGLMAFDGSAVREASVHRTVSKALEIGRAIRGAADRRGDVVDAVVQATGGYTLFRGRVLVRINEERDGFIWGSIRLTGCEDWAGQSFRLGYKNENHMSWLDDRPLAMSPDLITVLDAETGLGLSNFNAADWNYGREVVVLGIPCHSVWRSDRGLRIFHPARWGFACDYLPIEEVAGGQEPSS